MRLRRRPVEVITLVPPAWQPPAAPAESLEERTRRLRLEDQARLDAIGLPRYVAPAPSFSTTTNRSTDV